MFKAAFLLTSDSCLLSHGGSSAGSAAALQGQHSKANKLELATVQEKAV